MDEVKISANAALACGLWTVGITFVLLELAGVARLGQLGLAALLAGGVLDVKHLLAQQHQRDAVAFDLGRKSVRSIR